MNVRLLASHIYKFEMMIAGFVNEKLTALVRVCTGNVLAFHQLWFEFFSRNHSFPQKSKIGSLNCDWKLPEKKKVCVCRVVINITAKSNFSLDYTYLGWCARIRCCCVHIRVRSLYTENSIIWFWNLCAESAHRQIKPSRRVKVARWNYLKFSIRWLKWCVNKSLHRMMV